MPHRAIIVTAAAAAAVVVWLGLCPVPALDAADSTWSVDAGGNWSGSLNWDNHTPPNGPTDVARLTHNISADTQVTIDAAMGAGVAAMAVFLDDDSHNYTLASAGGTLTLRGFIQSDGAGRNHVVAAPVLVSLPITLVAQTADLTVSGSISGPGLDRSVIKDGPCTIFLEGANTYQGDTTVSDGVLTIRTDTALGATTAGTEVITGATLAVEHPSGLHVGAEALALSGAGVGGAGALRSLAGDNTWLGQVALPTDATIGVNGGSRLALSGGLSCQGALSKVGLGELVLSGTQAYGVGAALVAAAGTVRMDADAGGPAGDHNLAVMTMGHAAVQFGSTQHLAELNLMVGSSRLAAGGTVLATASLLVGPGDSVLDLDDGAMVVDYEDDADPTGDIVGWVRTGLNREAGGYWDGLGITSSAAAAEADRLTALGVVDNTDPKVGGKTVFRGETVDATSVLAMYTWWGDANLDGVVDANDYDVIDKMFLFTPDPDNMGWWTGDFNYDGVIDANDYDRIDKAFLFQTGPLADEAGGAATPTPEPATLALVALGLGLALRRRAGGG